MKDGFAVTCCLSGHQIRTIWSLASVSPHDLWHRFGLSRGTTGATPPAPQLMDHDSLETTRLSVQGTPQEMQRSVETSVWL